GMNHWSNWVPQDQASVTLGQSMSTTTLQLAALYSIFANDGLLVSPRLLADEETAEDRRVLSASTAGTVRDMLAYTVENSGIRNSMIPGMTLAGKTGTADIYDVVERRYVKGEYTLTFAGMFPADDPEVVMVVSLMKPAGDVTATYMAAPLFQAIGTEITATWDHRPPAERLADAH
ncbi:MAG TPA: penicillin-binding transpeptidase domain-containing protein, partial [Deinococcales bacterium]|nr:penicillin-binding transpeptidase domain-containing protein [Deinococcales bacterium]